MITSKAKIDRNSLSVSFFGSARPPEYLYTIGATYLDANFIKESDQYITSSEERIITYNPLGSGGNRVTVSFPAGRSS